MCDTIKKWDSVFSKTTKRIGTKKVPGTQESMRKTCNSTHTGGEWGVNTMHGTGNMPSSVP